MESAKRIIGVPFRKGHDPRRNPSGRPKLPLSKAAGAKVTDADAEAIVKVLIEKAQAGDLQAISMLWDRLEGRPISRQEHGDPGDFDSVSLDQARKVLRLPRGERRTG